MSESETKIYVGGLAPDTTKETLEGHFGQYGEIIDCVVMVDKGTSRSRGFGFVTFKEPSAANAALGTANFLDGKEVACKKAVRDTLKAVRDTPKQLVQDASGVYNSVKIFVGGLPSTCDYDKLTGYFGRFGQIQDAVVMMDAQTQRHRGFGYVTFAEPSAVEAALTNYPENNIDGKWVEVKRCVPQEAMRDKGKGKGFDPSKGSSRPFTPPPSTAAPGMYPDPYAGWYGTDPYAGYAAYGMGYPQMAASPYGAYGMPAYPPQGPYGAAPAAVSAGAYPPRYAGYRSTPY